jgi:hypothetical protein
MHECHHRFKLTAAYDKLQRIVLKLQQPHDFTCSLMRGDHVMMARRMLTLSTFSS